MTSYYDSAAEQAVARASALADTAIAAAHDDVAHTHCVAAVGYAATRFRPVLRAILARIGRA